MKKKTLKAKKCKCKKCVKFRKKHDFEFLEIYDFYGHIARYVLPRLIQFKEKTCSNPCFTPEELAALNVKDGFIAWKQKLDEMIDAFQVVADDNVETDNLATVNKGLDTFRQYFFHLWM
jgi:hypothetical protein